MPTAKATANTASRSGHRREVVLVMSFFYPPTIPKPNPECGENPHSQISALTGSVIAGKSPCMNKGFSVLIETFTAALVLAVRYQITKQNNKRTARVFR
jgi:hypothetical protein